MPLQMLARGAAAEGKVHSRDAFRPLWPQAVIAIELSGARSGIKFTKTARSLHVKIWHCPQLE
jgi:hypothetical protein